MQRFPKFLEILLYKNIRRFIEFSCKCFKAILQKKQTKNRPITMRSNTNYVEVFVVDIVVVVLIFVAVQIGFRCGRGQ